jgi:hypothetical protein
MNGLRFRTPEVAELYDSISQWSHPEYPFLDKGYSPSSNAPATDYTLAIADWLQNGRIDAVRELWSYIAPTGSASEHILMNGTQATIPQQLKLPARVQAEIRAVFLLTLRAQFILFTFCTDIAVELAASVLACYPAQLVKPGSTPTEPSETVMMLREVAPMVRLVVYRYFADSWHVGRLNLNLGYDDRMYGCGREHNKVAIEKLGFFGPPTDNVYVPGTITKNVLKTELESAGFQFNKSDTRKRMIEVARSVPGLVSTLVAKRYPEMRIIRDEWHEPVNRFASGISASKEQSRAILTAMGLSTLQLR